MQKYPRNVIEIINIFKTLPGIGNKTAERLTFSLLNWSEDKQKAFGALIQNIPQSIANCKNCGNIADIDTLCSYCNDPLRNSDIICVVENSAQIPTIDAGGVFKGLFHVLGGRLSPLHGRTPDSLNINSLLSRIKKDHVQEVILALGHDVESQATAIYISNLLQNTEVKISRLARGLPAGSDIAYADHATLAAAFSGRTYLN